MAHLSFRNYKVFGIGFLSGPKATTEVTRNMCIAGLIDLSDGSIDESALFLPHFEEHYISYLWSYIYYLYYVNRTEISVFKFMMDDVTKHASAHNFYHVVRSVLNDFDQVVIFKDVTPLDKLQLATFILKILRKYKDRIKIPILKTLQDMVKREQPQMFSPEKERQTEIKLRTSEDQMPEVVTNEKDVLKSDIRLIVTNKPVVGGFKKRRAKRS
jgi:hypothetical protein